MRKIKLWYWFLSDIFKRRKQISKALNLCASAPLTTLALHHLIDNIIKQGPPITKMECVCGEGKIGLHKCKGSVTGKIL